MCHKADVQVTYNRGSDFLSRYPCGRVIIEITCGACGQGLHIQLDSDPPGILGIVDDDHYQRFVAAVAGVPELHAILTAAADAAK